MSYGVGCRDGSDLVWLWHRLASIWPPALGTSMCHGCGPKKRGKKRNTQNSRTQSNLKMGRLGIPLWHSWVKDAVLSLQGPRFNPWPRNFHTPWVWPKKKKKKRKDKTNNYPSDEESHSEGHQVTAWQDWFKHLLIVFQAPGSKTEKQSKPQRGPHS